MVKNSNLSSAKKQKVSISLFNSVCPVLWISIIGFIIRFILLCVYCYINSSSKSNNIWGSFGITLLLWLILMLATIPFYGSFIKSEEKHYNKFNQQLEQVESSKSIKNNMISETCIVLIGISFLGTIGSRFANDVYNTIISLAKFVENAKEIELLDDLSLFLIFSPILMIMLAPIIKKIIDGIKLYINYKNNE